ncbi:hypothetical protein, partial [Gelidibacter salicanalis]|uniref:hypothetical protein n=1 Tax=Gelidibacter salicanalis TaxID=291193 RepID=UPI001F45BCF5
KVMKEEMTMAATMDIFLRDSSNACNNQGVFGLVVSLFRGPRISRAEIISLLSLATTEPNMSWDH